MRIEVLVCDRCGSRIEGDDQSPHFVHRVTREGSLRRTVDLCETCEHDIEALILGRTGEKIKPREESQIGTLRKQVRTAEDALTGVRRMASDALKSYADGASADRLAETLRDIASNANRVAVGSRAD